jgi:hypothetical protein
VFLLCSDFCTVVFTTIFSTSIQKKNIPGDKPTLQLFNFTTIFNTSIQKKNIQNIPGDNPLYVTIFLAIVFTTIFNTSIKKKGMTSHDILLIL